MVNKTFVEEQLTSDQETAKTESFRIESAPVSIQKSMNTLWKKHCYSDCRTPQIHAFVCACNALGFSKSETLNFIIANRSSIAADSSCITNPSKIEDTVNDAYRRYADEHGKHKSNSGSYANHLHTFSGINGVNPVTKENLLDRIEASLVNLDSKIEQPIPTISIDDNCISSSGNLTILAGASKGGKTGFLNGLIAGSVNHENRNVDSFGCSINPNTSKKLVLHLDNEQAVHNHHKAIKGIIRRSGLSHHPDYFKSCNLRKFTPDERREALKAMLEKYSALFNGVFAVFIDGIADLVNSVNEETECNAMVLFLEGLAMQYNCPIISVLHYNPNTEKGRGHLGSQCERKCESFLSITRDKDGVSVIEGKLLRNGGIIPLNQFVYDLDLGYHVSAGIKDKSQEAVQKFELIKTAAKDFFDNGLKELSYTELFRMFMEAEGIGERWAKERVKKLIESGLIQYSDKTRKKLKFNGALVH